MKKLIPAQWQTILGFEVIDPDGWDRANFNSDWIKELTFEEFMDKAEISTCSRHFDRTVLVIRAANYFETKLNKYRLKVYKVSTGFTESPNGASFSVILKEIWNAPFKNETDLLASVLDFSSRGFYCKVEKN